MKLTTRPGNKLTLGHGPDAEPVTLSPEDREVHLYVPGASRAGKSKFLEFCIRQNVKQWRRNGYAVVLIDPHSKLYQDVIARLTSPGNRRHRESWVTPTFLRLCRS